MADLSVSKPRVNGALLPKYEGKVVTLTGSAHDTDQDGMGFMLKTTDGVEVHVRLNEQLLDYIEGLVEVQGVTTNGNQMQGFNFVNFGPEASQSFDGESYNKAVNLMENNPVHYRIRDGLPQTS